MNIELEAIRMDEASNSMDRLASRALSHSTIEWLALGSACMRA